MAMSTHGLVGSGRTQSFFTMTYASFMSQFKPIPSLGLHKAQQWLEPWNRKPIMRKKELLTSDRDAVIRSSPESIPAQEELLELIMQECDQMKMHITPKGPLELASLMVIEDLCIMLPIDGTYQLVAAAVFSPSNWKLAEKFKQNIAEIHQKVPGFDEDMTKKVDHVFRGLAPDRILERYNWSIYTDPTLYQPEKLPGKEFYLRIERQTIRKLERSKGIVFTIGVHVDPLKDVVKDDHMGPQLKQAINDLPQEVLDYKEMNYSYKE